MFFMLISQRWSYTDGEAVIMLAFHFVIASGRGSTPLRCNNCYISTFCFLKFCQIFFHNTVEIVIVHKKNFPTLCIMTIYENTFSY